MMTVRRKCLTALLAIFILLSGLVRPVAAARGIPGSPEFGIGARLSLTSPDLSDALLTVKSLQLDWLSIDFSWSDFQPEKSLQINLESFDQAVKAARQNHIAVLLSISNPPSWAMTAKGPDPELTLALLKELTSQYPGSVDAIEFFPAPNTNRGWGITPDPTEYLNLYKRITTELADWDKTILLVAGSLEVSKKPAVQDISDVNFLRTLFSLDTSLKFPVIGLRFPSVEGSPSAPAQSQDSVVLRHYEDIRELIKSSGRSSSLIWITYMDFPEKACPEKQADYLSRAYTQIRSQLYIGSAFLQGINTCTQALLNCREVSLRTVNGTFHPFYPALHNILLHNAPAGAVEFPGRTKSEIFKKSRNP